MSQELSTNQKSSFLPDFVGLSPQLAFKTAMENLRAAGKCTSAFLDIKALLRMAGFSQNGRSRIIKLSGEEISALCNSSPKDDELWRAYMNELQTLLSRMDQARKIDSCLGRPYITAELASTVLKLSRLRYLKERGFHSVQASKMRDLLLYDGWCKSLARLVGIGQSADQTTSESIQIQPAIKFVELYRNELLLPPRLKTKVNLDEFALWAMEDGNFRFMDDGGNEFLEDIRDIPLVTYYDELPNFESVLDWLIATKPVFDSNQIKRGWLYLEGKSKKWHLHDPDFYFYEDLIQYYSGWNCVVIERNNEWLAELPTNNPYTLIPLTMPQQLMEESQTMHHCVVSYLDDCADGRVKIFSVRDSISDQRIATAELANHDGLWKLAQLKGKHNQELIHLTYVTAHPLGIILDALVKWYNKVAGCET